MKRLFILFCVTCSLFSSSLLDEARTAVEFAHFVEHAQQHTFSNKNCSNIADQLVRFCKFEGHGSVASVKDF